MSDIFDYGFDSGLNKPIASTATPLLYDSIGDQIQGQTINVAGFIAGAANTIYNVDPTRGMWMGAQKFDDAPFAVNMQGEMRATSGVFQDIVTVSSFTAYEAILTGQAVALGDGVQFTLPNDTSVVTTAYAIDTTNWASQKFTTQVGAIKLHSVTVALKAAAANNYSITLSIRADSAGAPTGADLVSLTQSCALTTSAASFGFTFATALSIPSAATSYHILVRRSTIAEGSTVSALGDNIAGQGANASANSGSTWAVQNGPLRQAVNASESVAGQAMVATAASGRARTTNFIGFAYETKAAGQTIRVAIFGTALTLTSLTAGFFYYLSDTLGAVSTTAGTFTRKVGLSVSTTKMLITNIW